MGKVKKNIFVIIITISTITLIVLLTSVICFTQTNKYVGAYNLDDRYSIILKQDGACDFTESGVSAYTGTELKCSYKVENTNVTIERDMIRFKWVGGDYLSSSSSQGDTWMPGTGCAQFSNKPGECKEEIVRIQETAIIGDTEMLYKDKVYTRLK